MERRPSRVVIISPYQLIIESLSILIERDESYRVVGSFETASPTTANAALQLQPDVILADCIAVADSAGDLELLGTVAPVLVLADQTVCQKVGGCCAAKWDVVYKQSTVTALRNALESSVSGRRSMDISGFRFRLRGNTMPEPGLADTTTPYALSSREETIVRAICNGMSNKEIAQELGIAYTTVKNHVASIMTKLDAHSRVDIVLKIQQTR